MAYRLGLDIGTNSIGWWVLTLDAEGHPNGSLAAGVRIFSDGRNPKDGTSLAVQRRGPRGMRRRRDRYLLRRDDLMEMLRAVCLMPPDEAERKCLETLDPYELRAKALHGPLTPHELGRTLFHLNQRRGFKSNRKTDKPEDNKLTEKIGELKRRIMESGAKTLGEYLHKRRLKGKMVRARPEAGFYPDRALYEEEFDEIRKAQAAHHALRPEQWDYLRDKIIFRQRDLRPVDPGWCLLEDGERRAPRALPCAQEFRMVQEANNLRILVAGERARRLTRGERDKVLNELRTKKEMKLETLWKLLKLPTGTPVNLLDENRKALKGDETAARLKDTFGRGWQELPLARRTEIVRTLIEAEKPDDVERVAQAEWGLDAPAARKLALTPLPEGHARLSEKAIAKLLPIMEEQGLGFAEAVAEIPEYGHHSDFRPDAALDRLPYYGAILTRQVVGGDKAKPKDDEVAHYGRIANPTVHIGLGQLRRVVNRLVEIYGKPEEIVVELARELKMNKEDKEAERRKIKDNEEANRRREQQIKSADGIPSPELLRKLRLCEEQTFGSVIVCPFTGEPISFKMAISDATEIEHILPFSKTLDDSMANKVVCLREVNRVKRDRAPAEAFQSNPLAGKFRCNYDEILLRADKLPPNKRWRFHDDFRRGKGDRPRAARRYRRVALQRARPHLLQQSARRALAAWHIRRAMRPQSHAARLGLAARRPPRSGIADAASARGGRAVAQAPLANAGAREDRAAGRNSGTHGKARRRVRHARTQGPFGRPGEHRGPSRAALLAAGHGRRVPARSSSGRCERDAQLWLHGASRRRCAGGGFDGAAPVGWPSPLQSRQSDVSR
jgi:CRISPR-associated endonuclease Csn1